MVSFARIRKEALARHGEKELKSRLPAVKSAAALKRVSDDRYFSQMSQRIFRAGLNHTVVDGKWAAFERSFHKFDPRRGYFRAGIGILMLTRRSRILMKDAHAAIRCISASCARFHLCQRERIGLAPSRPGSARSSAWAPWLRRAGRARRSSSPRCGTRSPSALPRWVAAIRRRGTFLHLPAWSGKDTFVANATSSVALTPGVAASGFAYRQDLARLGSGLDLRLVFGSGLDLRRRLVGALLHTHTAELHLRRASRPGMTGAPERITVGKLAPWPEEARVVQGDRPARQGAFGRPASMCRLSSAAGRRHAEPGWRCSDRPPPSDQRPSMAAMMGCADARRRHQHADRHSLGHRRAYGIDRPLAGLGVIASDGRGGDPRRDDESGRHRWRVDLRRHRLAEHLRAGDGGRGDRRRSSHDAAVARRHEAG